MNDRSTDLRRVVVLDTDSARRAATCALLERAGYAAVGGPGIHAIARHLDAPETTVLLVDVSLPRTWRDVMEEHAVVRALVDERIPIVLHGTRPESELSELEWATRATAHIPFHPEGKHLLGILRRILPLPARAAPLTTRPPSGAKIPVVVNAPKLLLIDDSEMTLEMMQSLLVDVGFDVRIAVALGEIRSIVANWLPSIIVADVKRPDIPGDELCARLKASVDRSDVVVLLCSSLPDKELASIARNAHADGYVSKSQGLDSFVEQLAVQTRRLLRPQSSAMRAPEVR